MAFGWLFVSVIAAQLWVHMRNPLPTPWRNKSTAGSDEPMLADAVKAALDRGDRVLVIGARDFASGPSILGWRLSVGGELLRRAPVPRWLSRRLLRVVERYDGPAKLRPTYVALPERLEPNAFAQSVHDSVSRGDIDALIVVVPAADSAKFPPSYFEPALAHPSLTLVSSRMVGERSKTRLDEYRVTKGRGPVS